MKNKKFIYLLILCITVMFLYACSDETPPEDESVTVTTETAEEGKEVTIEDSDEGTTAETTEEIDAESEINDGNESENPESENMTYSEAEPESDSISPPVNSDMTKIGYFTVETPQGEAPVLNNDDTMTLPGGGTITADNGTQFTAESGAVLYCDEQNSPFKLSVHDSLRIASGDTGSMLIESPNGFTISIDGMTEGTTGEDEKVSGNLPWWIYFNENKNAVFEFVANGVKCTSFDSVFPMYKDADNGTILFKKCKIELTDGTIIEAPLNTIAKITDGVFTITIGMGEASMLKSDGTVSVIPKGTVIDSNFLNSTNG